ncbi:MAG: hypothetical protein K0S44_253 [Bacteroidetes bacterium]|jgi:hypothetical protein|nr:hypothetical protein [Bacteroidota bacterium]
MAKEYFSHDHHARNDLKIRALILKHKWKGYGIYWALIEMLNENNGFIFLSELSNICRDLKINRTLFDSILQDFELFSTDGERFWSDSVLKRLKIRNDKSVKASESANKRWHPHANALRDESDSNALNKSKVNKSKVKDIKLNGSISEQTFMIRIGNELYTQKPSEIFLQHYQLEFETTMMNSLAGLKKDAVLSLLDTEYPVYDFRDRSHFINTLKSIGTKIRNKNHDTNQPIAQTSYGRL